MYLYAIDCQLFSFCETLNIFVCKQLKKRYYFFYGVTLQGFCRLFSIIKKQSINLKSFIMKKSAVIIAIALGFSFTSLNATNNILPTSTYETVTKKVVDPFCISIVKGDFDTVKKLIDLGQDVNKKSNGLTPAMYAAKYNRLDILKLLVEKGAKLELKSTKGVTALVFAERSNAKDVLAYIKGLES